VPDVAVADMSPPKRRPCARLASRITVLSDGRIVSCEEDVVGQQVLGRIGVDSLADVWQQRFGAMRSDHQRSIWEKHPVCAKCKEWHRA
jgi:radical SAM protein with 4Fe4S-binding SPASM domain